MKVYLVFILFFSLLMFSFQHTIAQQNKPTSSALMSVVEAERSFAGTSVQKGIRDSFIEFFADDGVNFTPAPTNAKEFYGKRPAGASPVTLDWYPIYADVAQSAEMGYTTGPYTLTNKEQQKVVGQGYYFSVWKKQADGNWKVMADIGIQTPAFKSMPTALFETETSASTKKFNDANLDAISEQLMESERYFSTISFVTHFQKAYLNLLDNNARLHRNYNFPFVGKEAIKKFISANKFFLTYEPIKADVSQSADLAYTYGSYEIKVLESGSKLKNEKGYYLHVWKRVKDGKWKLVAEIMNQ